MRFVTVRDLRNKPAQIRRSLLEEKDIVLTSNGKPFAIVTLTSEKVLEKSLAMMRRIRAENAAASMQKQSMETGTDKLSLDEINAEVSAVRERRK
ncbi:MAG: type II toxin-antitoxin system Phd/YefM family antitoxin [Candidatus Omnitrophica bacterium]|nr:type II toxin-antitoxin system Phd/YefM family antitoxin [Candidatus Omnitrophota bacterium]